MALTGEAKKAYQRELMRKRREELKAEKLEEPKDEMLTEEAHPVFPWLKRYADRKYDKNGVVLFEQRCEKCNGTWGATIEIECPYCHGKGKKAA